MRKKGQPRLPCNTDGVIIASHLLMTPYSVGADAIFVTNLVTGPQGAGRLLKQKMLENQQKQSKMEILYIQKHQSRERKKNWSNKN